jgi:ribosomal protein L37AE/L43A
MIEIKMTKCRLFLTEPELESLLARDPELWAAAIKRGKGILRARAAARRDTRWHKYTCPYCGKVIAVGEIFGIIKCKRCGKVTTLTGEYSRVKPTGNATTSAR